MAILTAKEMKQNEKLLDEILTNHFSGIIVSENIKAAFLKKCRNEAIWLPGLSPMVQTAFLQALALAIKDDKHNVEQKLDAVLKALQAELKRENEFLKGQFQASAGRTSARVNNDFNISDYMAHNKAAPNDYWLKTLDVINALAPLRQYSNIYIHEQPVAKIDAAVEKCIDAAFATNNKTKAAYVLVESGGHWTLEIYTKQNNQLIREHYNPPGDGKCGDHTINKVIYHARAFLSKENKQDLACTIGNYGQSSALDADAARQQTLYLVKKGLEHQAKQNKIEHLEINTTHVSTTVPTAISKARTVTKTTAIKPSKNTESTEINALFKQWNALANHVIDELAQVSEHALAKRIDRLFADASYSINNKIWDPRLFHQHQCGAEIEKDENAAMELAIKNSVLIQ